MAGVKEMETNNYDGKWRVGLTEKLWRGVRERCRHALEIERWKRTGFLSEVFGKRRGEVFRSGYQVSEERKKKKKLESEHNGSKRMGEVTGQKRGRKNGRKMAVG